MDERSPEDIPPGTLAHADQLQAQSAVSRTGITAQIAKALEDARKEAVAGDRPLTLDEQSAMVRAELELEDLVGPDDLDV